MRATRIWRAGALLAGMAFCSGPAHAQCDTIRYQHYDGAAAVPYPDLAFGNMEEYGIVVDTIPPEHFPIELTRVGFVSGNTLNVSCSARVFDTWPPAAFNPVPTYARTGLVAVPGANEFDLTPVGPVLLAAQPFTVTVQGIGTAVIVPADDGNGCGAGPDRNVYHYALFPGPGWFGHCPPDMSSGDWVFWIEYRPAAVGTPVCLGDGSLVDCPCGAVQNGPAGAGCLHSLGEGGVLSAFGKAQVSDDTLVLQASHLPPTTIALYFQSSLLGAPSPFGDGLVCAGGQIVRLTGTQTQAGASCIGASTQPVSVLGQVPLVGATRNYQVWYRNASASWCTPERFNLSSGLQIVWAP